MDEPEVLNLINLKVVNVEQKTNFNFRKCPRLKNHSERYVYTRATTERGVSGGIHDKPRMGSVMYFIT